MAALPDAWIYYRSPKPHSRLAFAAEYQLQCHLDSPITFLGVWDTVGSLGIPGSLLAAGKALDRLSGGFEVTSVIQAGKYDES